MRFPQRLRKQNKTKQKQNKLKYKEYIPRQNSGGVLLFSFLQKKQVNKWKIWFSTSPVEVRNQFTKAEKLGF